MPYDPPTREQFRNRFDEFCEVGDDLVDAIIVEATRSVSKSWVERDYQPAIMLLTAHLLLVEGHLDRASGRRSTMTTTGPISSEQVGDVRVTYAGVGGASGGAADPNGYGATQYGKRFLALMRANFAGPMVV